MGQHPLNRRTHFLVSQDTVAFDAEGLGQQLKIGDSRQSDAVILIAFDSLQLMDHAQHPVGRVGRPEDAAALDAWLLGPESGFVTGAEFVTDGGMTRKMIYLDD